MIKRISIAFLILVMMYFTAQAQFGVSFYTMGNATFQSMSYNPAYIPKGRIFIGLPLLSGVGGAFNSPVSYNQLVQRNESGILQYNVENAVNQTTANSMIGAYGEAELFHFMLRTKRKGVFSVFGKVNSHTDITTPREAMEWFWFGNATLAGLEIDFDRVGITSNTWYEIGVGYANSLLDGKLTYGGRLKYYQGLMNISTPANFGLKTVTEGENFQLNADLTNGVLRSAGVDILRGREGDRGSYLLTNGNRGAGLDFGFDYRINEWYSFSLAVRDFGFINWSEGVRNRVINGDTTFRYVGVELDGMRNLRDSINAGFFDNFGLTENQDAYTTLMPTQTMGSFTWHSPYFNIDMVTSGGMRIIQGQPKMMYGLGLRKHWSPKLIGAVSATRLPQQFVNMGASLSFTAGVAQIYAAVDRTVGFSAPDMKWATAKIGMNLVFGSGKKAQEEEFTEYIYKKVGPIRGGDAKQGAITTRSFLGRQVDPKKTEDIYTIIAKQEKSKARTATPDLDRVGQKRGSPASASGSQQRLFGRKKPKVQTATGREKKGFFEWLFGGNKKKRNAPSASGRPDWGKRKGNKNQRSSKPKFKKYKRKNG
jgi:hypothetical protein